MQPCIYLRLKVRMSISCGFLEHSKVLSTIGVKLKIADTYSNDFRPYFSHATTFLICNCVKRLRLFFSYKFNHCFHWHCLKFQFNHPNNSIREEYTPKSQFTFFLSVFYLHPLSFYTHCLYLSNIHFFQVNLFDN